VHDGRRPVPAPIVHDGWSQQAARQRRGGESSRLRSRSAPSFQTWLGRFRCRHLGACRDVGSDTGGSAVRAL